MNTTRGLVRITGLTREYFPNGRHKYIFKTFPGYSNIQICSSNALPEYRGVSPLVLGPIWIDDPFVKRCEIFENFWHWTKVFKQDLLDHFTITPPTSSLKSEQWFEIVNGVSHLPDPSKKYFEKRTNWFKSKSFDNTRYRKNKKRRDDFLYFWYNGEKEYDYVNGRKLFYCHLYASYVQETSAYKLIKSRLESGENICLTGWDGFDWSEEKDPKCEILYNTMMNKDKAFGHEAVLAGLLTGNQIWEENS